MALTEEQKQKIHNETGAGHSLICLVEAYITEAYVIAATAPLLERITELEACLLQSQNAAIDLAKQVEQAAQPVSKGAKHEKEPGTWPVDSRPAENGGPDSIGACTESRNGENQRDEHRTGNANAERENDQRDCRGDGVQGPCDVSSPDPYGQVTTHCMTGQQFFYRWPQLPYLDNASECVTVYTAPPKAVPLSQPEKQRLWNDATYNNPSSTTDAAMDYGSAIEAAHGITPAAVEKGDAP